MTNFSRVYDIAGRGLRVASPDSVILDEIARVLPASEHEHADWSVTVETQGARGTITIAPGDDHRDLLTSVGTSEFPFHAVDGRNGELALAFEGETAPILWTEGTGMGFRVEPRWRTVVSLLVFHKALRLRDELIFFHASSVDIDGAACMFVGPKGAGKSTTALALATRGHRLLGDETAAWNPATGALHPFLRDIGIKPGPRASGVDERLRELGKEPEAAGVLRLPASEVFPGRSERQPTPLRAVFFLHPFAQKPELIWREAGREDLRRLQPISGSTVNASIAMRTFQLSRMISSSRICDLTPGDPDQTAAMIEKEVPRQWA